MPKEYDVILGLTGTLEKLHESMKKIMKGYSIKKEIYAPSMFDTS